MDLWRRIETLFSEKVRGRPASSGIKVIKTLLSHGLRVDREGRVYCGKVKVSYTALAEACGLDRRTVRRAIKTLLSDPELSKFFEMIEPAGPFLRKVTRMLGYRCLVIETYEDKPGIIATVSGALAKRGINIVQIVAEDPNLYENPKLYVITASEIPGETLTDILSDPVIKSLTIY